MSSMGVRRINSHAALRPEPPGQTLTRPRSAARSLKDLQSTAGPAPSSSRPGSSDAQGEVIRLRRELNEAKKALTAQYLDDEGIRKSMPGPNANVEDYRNYARASEMAIRRLEDELKTARKRVVELERGGAKGEDGMWELKAKMHSQQEEMKDLQRRLGNQAPQSVLNGALGNDDRQALLKSVRELQDRLRIKEGEAQDLAKARQSEKQHKDRANVLASKCRDLEDQLRAKMAQIHQFQVKKVDVKFNQPQAEQSNAKLAAAESSLAESRMQCQQLKSDLEKANKSRAESDAESKRLQDELEAMQAVIAAQEQKKAKQANSQNELAEQSRKLAEFKALLADSKKNLDVHKGQSEKYKETIDSINKKLADAQAELSKMKKELQASNAERDQLRDAASKAAGATKGQIEELNKQLKVEKEAHDSSVQITERAKQELEELKRKAALDKGSMQSEAAALRKRTTELSKELQEMKIAKEAMASKLKDASRNAEDGRDAQGRVKEMQAKIAALEIQTKSAVQEKESAEKQLAPLQIQNQYSEKLLELTGHVNRLQTLLRMAEITKLEEILRAMKRVEAVREDFIALLNYNLSASEGQNLRENKDAVDKQVRTRNERLALLKKKMKQEDEKIKTAQQTFETQTKRLKEKLKDYEQQLAKHRANKP